MKRILLAAMLVIAGASPSAQAGSLNGGGVVVISPCSFGVNCPPINICPVGITCLPNNGGIIQICTLTNGQLVCTPNSQNGGTTTNGGTPVVTVDEPGILQLLGIFAVAGLGFFLRRRK